MRGLWVSGGDTGLARGFGGLVPRGCEELIGSGLDIFRGSMEAQNGKARQKAGFSGDQRLVVLAFFSIGSFYMSSASI